MLDVEHAAPWRNKNCPIPSGPTTSGVRHPGGASGGMRRAGIAMRSCRQFRHCSARLCLRAIAGVRSGLGGWRLGAGGLEAGVGRIEMYSVGGNGPSPVRMMISE